MNQFLQRMVKIGAGLINTKQRKIGIVLLLVGGLGLFADGCKSGGIDKGYAWCVASHTAQALVTCPRSKAAATPKGKIAKDAGQPDKPATRPGH